MQKIKTALCSFGMSGKVFHAPFIHAHPGFEFSAVLERTKTIAQTIYPDKKIIGTGLDEIMDNKKTEIKLQAILIF